MTRSDCSCSRFISLKPHRLGLTGKSFTDLGGDRLNVPMPRGIDRGELIQAPSRSGSQIRDVLSNPVKPEIKENKTKSLKSARM